MKYWPWISAVILVGCAHQDVTGPTMPLNAKPGIRPIMGVQESKPAVPTNKEYLLEELNYSRLVDAFDKNDGVHFQKQFKKIESLGPKSLYLDRALYLSGMLALSNKDHATALTQFNRVLKTYPHSAVVPTTLYAKGVTLKRMNWVEGAKKSLLSVTRQFPGSPEAERAETEIKLINMGAVL